MQGLTMGKDNALSKLDRRYVFDSRFSDCSSIPRTPYLNGSVLSGLWEMQTYAE